MHATPTLPQALRVLSGLVDHLEAQGLTVDSAQVTRFGGGSVQVHDPLQLRAARDAIAMAFVETSDPRIRGEFSSPSLSFAGTYQGLKLDLYGSAGDLEALGIPTPRTVRPAASSTPAQ